MSNGFQLLRTTATETVYHNFLAKKTPPRGRVKIEQSTKGDATLYQSCGVRLVLLPHYLLLQAVRQSTHQKTSAPLLSTSAG